MYFLTNLLSMNHLKKTLYQGVRYNSNKNFGNPLLIFQGPVSQ
jgi:hypothetical protein